MTSFSVPNYENKECQKKKGAREILYSNVRHRPKSEGQERKLTRYRKCGLEAFRPSEYVENWSLTTLSTLIKLLLYTTYNKFTSQNRLVAHPGECLLFSSLVQSFSVMVLKKSSRYCTTCRTHFGSPWFQTWRKRKKERTWAQCCSCSKPPVLPKKSAACS